MIAATIQSILRMNGKHGKSIGRRRLWRMAAYVVLSLPVFWSIQLASYWLRFEGAIDQAMLQQIGRAAPWVALIKALMFAWLGVYQGWNRFVTFYDLIVLAQASVGSSLVMVLSAYFFAPTLVIPRSVFLLDCLGTIGVFGALRSAWRLVHELRGSLRHQNGRTRALIVGANDAGEALLRAIRRNPNLSYQIVGFIRGSDLNTPVRIAGIPVLGSLNDLVRIASLRRVNEILMMADEFSGREVRQIMQSGNTVGADVKVLPSYEQLLHRRVDLRPRTVSIEDLLRREPVKIDMRGLHRWIDGRVLMVTGSAGSIGSEICRQLLQFEPRRLIVIDRSENGQFFLQRELRELAPQVDLHVYVADVGDRCRMEQLLREHRPDIVFHAAAYKHVPLMEMNPGEAIKNIVTATRCLADLAEEYQVASFVMISTDKAVNPTSVMGACKRVAEMYVQALAATANCQFVTVRFGNVLDSAGSVVPIFREQIAKGGPVTVTHPEMKRFFMMIPEASQLVIQAGAMGHGGEIFVLDMGQPVRILDLAREMIQLSGLEVGRDIEIRFTGLRPGEKMFEELHNPGEIHLPTVHPKILVADSTQLDPVRAQAAVEWLHQLADGSQDRIRLALHKIVPQYQGVHVSAALASRRAA